MFCIYSLGVLKANKKIILVCVGLQSVMQNQAWHHCRPCSPSQLLAVVGAGVCLSGQAKGTFSVYFDDNAVSLYSVSVS